MQTQPDDTLNWTCFVEAAQEALVAGHLPSTLERVRAEAELDAAVFCADYPGQDVEGDWDSQAWAMVDRDELLGGDPDVDGDCDLLWPVYAWCLANAVRSTHKSRVARLRAVLEASTDADEETLRGIFPRGDLSRADYRAAMEDAAEAAGGGLCEMCAHGGVTVTVTRNKREVRQGFLGTLWRGGEHACEDCGGATVSLHVCLECEDNGVRHEPDYYCPGCWRALED